MTTTTSSHNRAPAISSGSTDFASTTDAGDPLSYRTSWRDPVTYLPLATLVVFVLAWVGSLLAEPRPAGETAPALLSDRAPADPGSDRTHVYWPSDAGESLPPMP